MRLLRAPEPSIVLTPVGPQTDAARAWFSRRTFGTAIHPDRLPEAKHAQGLTLSVCLPALDEEATVGSICERIRGSLMGPEGLVDQLVVLDSGSRDRTAEVAGAAGAEVFDARDLVPEVPLGPGGKGDTMWRSLSVLTGDLVMWLDADIRDFRVSVIGDLVAPLLADPSLVFTKGFYGTSGDTRVLDGGGRITELVARPLLSLLFPLLSYVVHPLTGECAGRRKALLDLSFFTGYGVEIGMLVDVAERYGVDALAQVDLGRKLHRKRDLLPLGRASRQVIEAVMRRVDVRDLAPESAFIQFSPSEEGPVPEIHGARVEERPPMRTLLS